jgi:hypothetical protein
VGWGERSSWTAGPIPRARGSARTAGGRAGARPGGVLPGLPGPLPHDRPVRPAVPASGAGVGGGVGRDRRAGRHGAGVGRVRLDGHAPAGVRHLRCRQRRRLGIGGGSGVGGCPTGAAGGVRGPLGRRVRAGQRSGVYVDGDRGAVVAAGRAGRAGSVESAVAGQDRLRDHDRVTAPGAVGRLSVGGRGGHRGCRVG